jgi:hypothetical protein
VETDEEEKMEDTLICSCHNRQFLTLDSFKKHLYYYSPKGTEVRQKRQSSPEWKEGRRSYKQRFNQKIQSPELAAYRKTLAEKKLAYRRAYYDSSISGWLKKCGHQKNYKCCCLVEERDEVRTS